MTLLFRLATCLLASLAAMPLTGPALAEMQLVMIEQPGCLYCARWTEDIGTEYPKTAEGEAAPLRRIQLREPMPEDLATLRPASFTPTFVLVVDGQDMGRIEGYPGEDFFWPLLDDLIAKASP